MTTSTALRGRARVEYRREQAVSMAMRGVSYDLIAHELGYSNRSGPWKAVQAALRARTVEAVDEYRLSALDRLEAVYRALWPLVEAGDLKAFASALRTLDLQNRLLGLYEADEQGSSGYSIVQPDHPAFHAKVESAELEVAESLAG